MSIIMHSHLPDSVADLFNLQRTIIRELKLKNVSYPAADGELGFLRKQNRLLKSQIESVHYLIERLTDEKYPEADLGVMGIA